MQTPLQISFRNLETSDFIEGRVRSRAERLEQFSADIIGCRVVIETPHRSARSPKNPIGIGLEVEVPGKLLVARAEQHQRDSKDDDYSFISQAFSAMERQLEDYSKQRKEHPTHHGHMGPLVGRVVRLFREQDYGFIERGEGPDLYFHRAVVQDDAFDQLEVGTSVEYTPAAEEGAVGPQASTVQLIGHEQKVR